MKSWKAWLLVVVIFATGAAAGAFGMRLYMARHLPEMLWHTRQRLEEVFLDNIDREVGLTTEQREKILPILRDAVQKGEVVRHSVRDKIDVIMTDADSRIDALLDPGQQAKFKAFRERMAELRRQGEKFGPPPPPPPGFPPGPPPGPDMKRP